MEKTMTLNLRVNPTVKQQAEDVLKQLGIPMATAIDMYLRQITPVSYTHLFGQRVVTEKGALADIIQITRMNEGFFRERGLFLNGGKFFLLLGEGLTGFSKRLYLLIGLSGQGVQPLLLPLDFELSDSQVFFGAATFAALHIGVPGRAHIVEEIVLQDAVRLLQDWFAVLLQHRLSGIVQQGLGCPLLAPADLHDGDVYKRQVHFLAKRRMEAELPIEKVGAELRSMMSWLKK